VSIFVTGVLSSLNEKPKVFVALASFMILPASEMICFAMMRYMFVKLAPLIAKNYTQTKLNCRIIAKTKGG